MPKRYLDEIEIGETHESPGITITDWHVMGFAGLSMDFFELHTNDEFARQTQFGRRVAHGLLGLAVTDGLKNRSTFQVEGVASVHWSWDFVGPIFVGDTVTAKLRVAEEKAVQVAARTRHRQTRHRARQPARQRCPKRTECNAGQAPSRTKRTVTRRGEISLARPTNAAGVNSSLPQTSRLVKKSEALGSIRGTRGPIAGGSRAAKRRREYSLGWSRNGGTLGTESHEVEP